MKAKQLIKDKSTDEEGDLTEFIVWEVPRSEKYAEGVRYRFAFIRKGEKTPAVLYDNHHPKGHHKHIGSKQYDYDFYSIDKLMDDFLNDVKRAKRETRP